MIYRAEDISLGIDGREVAAVSVAFSSSYSLAEDRRLGATIARDGFLENGPSKSRLSMNFYLTGNNVIFDLLSGLDAYHTGSGIARPFKNGSSIKWIGHEDYLTFSYTGTSFPWVANPSSWSRTGVLGCVTGSTIYLGGQAFASGAALTSLSFSLTPFEPILCSAEFEIYNRVTGTFPTGRSSININPSNVAHGYFSNYSGVTGITEVNSITWSITAEREPRYVIGMDSVHDIKTVKATKEISFNGWGESSPVLEDSLGIFSITLGSQSNGSLYQDQISGQVIDESFDLPEVGIMAKKFRIIENLV